MSASDHIPSVQVVGNEDGTHIGLHGWDNFERWALANDPQYRHVEFMAKTYGLSPLEKYRFYIGYLTKLNTDLFAVIAEKRATEPIFIPRNQ